MPILLSTWSFGRRANAAAWPTLSGGGQAIDAVEVACRDAEDDVSNHTVGRGGWPDRDGHVTLDASIMLSPARSGAVCGVRDFACAISIARAVMERTPHKLLAGEAADAFGRAQGFCPQALLTDDARKVYDDWLRAGRPGVLLANYERLAGSADKQTVTATATATADAISIAREQMHDTIGVLALDSAGTLAGGCTTSGLAFKLPGRVGDSPIIGHGLYVVPGIGGAVCSGRGERIAGVCAAFVAVDALRAGKSPDQAARAVLDRMREAYPDLGADDQAGIIVLDAAGNVGSASLLPGFEYAVRDGSRDAVFEATVA